MDAKARRKRKCCEAELRWKKRGAECHRGSAAQTERGQAPSRAGSLHASCSFVCEAHTTAESAKAIRPQKLAMHCVAQEEIERLRALKNSPRSSPVDGDGWDEELRGFMELVPIRIDDLLPSKLPVRRASLLRRRRRECSSAGNHGASAALQNARMQSSRRVEIRNNVFHTLNAHRKNIKLAYHYYLSRSMSRPHLRSSKPPLASLHAPSCEPRQTLGPPGLRGCSPPRTSRLRMPASPCIDASGTRRRGLSLRSA